MKDLNIGIISSTVRDGNVGSKVAQWVLEQAMKISDNTYEIVDLKEYPMGFNLSTADEHAVKLNEKLMSFDGYIMITAEYNHSIPGVLKNALDWVGMQTMANRPAGIISYGAVGGARAAEHLRNILGQLNVADISRQVLFSLFLDFDENKNFTPQQIHLNTFKELVNQVELWAKAFKTIR